MMTQTVRPAAPAAVRLPAAAHAPAVLYLAGKGDGNIRYFVVSERQLWHTQEVRSCIDALIEE